MRKPQTEWDESVIRAAYFCEASLLKNMLYLNPDSLNLTDEGCLLAEFPLVNYSEGSLGMANGMKRPTAQMQADTLEVILNAMGKKVASEPLYRIKTIDELPYGKKGERGMVFDSYGNTILHMIAVYEGSHFLPVLRKLGLDIASMSKVKNSKGQTPIDIALNLMSNMPLAFAIQREVYAQGQDEIIKQLRKIQRCNNKLTQQINELKSQKVISWSGCIDQDKTGCCVVFSHSKE